MRIEAAEVALLELSAGVDRGFRAAALYPHVVLALGHRSRTLYRGFIHAIQGPAPIAALALLRPLVEINILLRFLAQAPEERARLWLAERHRWALAVVQDIEADAQMGGRWLHALPTPDVLSEWRHEVDEARAAALAANLPGVRRKGRLIPETSEQVRLLGDPAASEAYTFAYRRFSGDVHGGIVSFDRLVVTEVAEGGWIALSDDLEPGEVTTTRQLALTAYASTLRLVSTALGLGVEEPADRLRFHFLGKRDEDDASQVN